MLREEDWENRILQLLEALPVGADGRKRIPLLVLLKAIEAPSMRAIHIAIAAILKARGYSRTTFRTSIGVVSGYISAPPFPLDVVKRGKRRGTRKTSSVEPGL